jgi:preprotein translocase subunit SecG
MSIRKVTICLAVILFISATVLAFTSNKRAEKKSERIYAYRTDGHNDGCRRLYVGN